MRLEVNNSHKKVSYEKNNKPFYKFKVGAASLLIGISLFSGATAAVQARDTSSNSIVWNIDGEDVKIPDELSATIESKVGKKPGEQISKEDLSEIKWLYLKVDNSITSLDFMKYFSNLKTLAIVYENDNIELLKDLSKITSLEEVTITSPNGLTIDSKTLSSIIGSTKIKKISVDGRVNFAPGSEEQLNKLETLAILNDINYDIDFSKLTNLKTLDLSDAEPYDIAIYLNTKEYNELVSNGVEIKFKDEDSREKYIKACQKLNKIVEELDIKEDSTEDEKLDAIMLYVLENLEYDKNVSETINNSDENIDSIAAPFYEDGYLYGALEKDSSICGNYSALTEALMDRICTPQTSYIARSENHAWNIVKINGEPYYVDVTWLDGLLKETQKQTETEENGHKTITITFEDETARDIIKRGEGKSLNWYRENPDESNIEKIDKNNSHEASYIPDYMLIDENDDTASIREEQASKKAEEIGDEKVSVNIGGREIVIGLGALLGVLGAAAGTVFAVKRKKEKDRRRRMMSQYSDLFNYSDDYSPRRYK